MSGEHGNGYEVGFNSHVTLFAIAGHHNLKIGEHGLSQNSVAFRNHLGEIGSSETCPLPEPRGIGLADQVSNLNVGLRGRFMRAPFPAGERHGGIMDA
jgi:hypothetical protein